MTPIPKTLQSFLPGGDLQGIRLVENLDRPVGAGFNGHWDTRGVAPGCDRAGRWPSKAPTVRPIPAQGSALGPNRKVNPTPMGRPNRTGLGRPVGAWNICGHVSWGVAPGCDRTGPWPSKAPTVRFITARGNAPGPARHTKRAPTGRHNPEMLGRPVGARDVDGSDSQGAALGCDRAGLWP